MPPRTSDEPESATQAEYEALRSYVAPRQRPAEDAVADQPDRRISIMEWLADIGQAALARFRRSRTAR
jgi:hypothetical protein